MPMIKLSCLRISGVESDEMIACPVSDRDHPELRIKIATRSHGTESLAACRAFFAWFAGFNDGNDNSTTLCDPTDIATIHSCTTEANCRIFQLRERTTERKWTNEASTAKQNPAIETDIKSELQWDHTTDQEFLSDTITIARPSLRYAQVCAKAQR